MNITKTQYVVLFVNKGGKKMGGSSTSEKKNEIIRHTWDYMLRTGLSHASIGDLCRETKISQSSLYYWFENKDDIWISAGKYGIGEVVGHLFEYTFEQSNNPRFYFDTILDEAEKYKHELRLAIQITTSPVFGERMREKTMEFNFFYEKYAEKIIDEFGCTYLQAEVFIYSIIAFVVDFAIWDDKTHAQLLLDNLYKRVENVINKKQEE